MIAFASLFLGLVMGVRPVTLLVHGTVAAIVLELDGRPVGRIEGSPWTRRIDFGTEFEPHELVARALDEKGEEIGRARQWINLPRPPVEIEILLEQDARQQAVAARLVWQSVLGPRPDRISVTFDGQELALDAERRVLLPSYDPTVTHVLTALLEYPNAVRSRADVVLGGGSAGEARSELTAVPVSFAKGAHKALSPEALQGRFRRKGTPLRVAAVERGPAEVLLVRGLDPGEAFQRFRSLEQLRLPQDSTVLEKQDRIRILWPVAREIPDTGVLNVLFEVSREFRGKGFRFLLTHVEYPVKTASPRRFTDAVAAAGLDAFASYSRRAVVLVLGSADRDESRYEPAAVRRYLEKIHVPLFVWSLDPSASQTEWGAVEDVSSPANLEKAVKHLRQELEAQQVVWLEGRHLPQDISLEEMGDGMTLVR